MRLNVRLTSRGAQISLGNDLARKRRLHFQGEPEGAREEELEKEIEADVAEWGRIKSSKNAEDWVGYLRKFPNGRFAEIAQTRLARLTAAASATAAAPVAATQSLPTARTEAEYDALLPKGTTYIDPEGNTRRKS